MRTGALLSCVMTAVLISACERKGALTPPEASDTAVTIQAHYAFIAENLEDPQWRSLYEATRQAGLSPDYSKADLLKAAIACDVDGIFLDGDDTDEMTTLIARAEAAGIPVITLMSDAVNSARICHIESGNYQVGQAYGRQIIAAAARKGVTGEQDVLVIVDDDENRGNRASAIAALLETVAGESGELSLNVTTETAREGVFTSAQAVRRRILSVDRVPDFIILFNEQDTLNTYQVLVDYNRLGDVTMIGCSSDPSILNAVAKGAVGASIITETNTLGESAVEAMNTYRETGHVSEYIAADTVVIDADAAERMLSDVAVE